MKKDINRIAQTRFADSLDFVKDNNKLQQVTDIYKEVLSSVEDRGIHAGIVTNAQKEIYDSATGKDFIRTNNYGPYLPELLPIITAWYPEFPLKELISVQDLDSPLAYIITSELLTATSKSDTLVGDAVETPYGPRTIRGRYPTGEVFGEKLVAADFASSGTDKVGSLLYYPIMTGKDELEKLKITTSALEDWEVTSVLNGVVTFVDANEDTNIIELETANGIMTVKGHTPVTVTVNYVWNIEFATNDNIPSVIEDMKLQTMEAKPRALAMEWTVFSEYVKKKQFGTDIRTQTIKRVLDLMYQYQVRYILDRMYFGATGAQQTVDLTLSGVDLNVRVQQVLKKLNVISHQVQKNTGRIEGNIIVCGNDLKSFLESLPTTFYKPIAPGSDYGFNGPRKIGTIGRYVIFYDDKLPDDEGFMTYRGTQWYDAAFYMGVFMPVAPTDIININIKVKAAFVSMEAYRLDKPSAIIPLKFEESDPAPDPDIIEP